MKKFINLCEHANAHKQFTLCIAEFNSSKEKTINPVRKNTSKFMAVRKILTL